MAARAGHLGMVGRLRQRMRVDHGAVRVGEHLHVCRGGCDIRRIFRTLPRPPPCSSTRPSPLSPPSPLVGRGERRGVGVAYGARRPLVLRGRAGCVFERRLLLRMAHAAIARLRPGEVNLHRSRLVVVRRSFAVVRLRRATRKREHQHRKREHRERRDPHRRNSRSSFFLFMVPSFPRVSVQKVRGVSIGYKRFRMMRRIMQFRRMHGE